MEEITKEDLKQEFIEYLFESGYDRKDIDEEQDLYIEFLENKIIERRKQDIEDALDYQFENF